MEIYLYQLSTGQKIRLSLSIQVDLQFWHRRGTQIRSLGRTTSINRACQRIKRPTNFPKWQKSLPIPTFTMKWEEIQTAAQQLYAQFQGRSLLASELIGLLRKKNVERREEEIWAAIQYLFLHKRVQIMPGVEWGTLAITANCHRCSAGYSHLSWRHCATCGEKCAMCQYCSLLGCSRSCSPFFCFEPLSEGKKRPFICAKLPHSLTESQQQAVHKIQQFLQSEQNQLLFWAVTGAGKTECLVPIIEDYLRQGRRVLWVTPRKDVVLELAPRFKQIFPTVRPIALYGGSRDAGEESPLIIATAHQAFRFFRSFDLGIVDEVDAFPLYKNKILAAGIRRALKEKAKQIFLTATPPRRWRRLAKNGRCSMVVLPVRHHGFPLPVPIMKRERRLWSKIDQGQPVHAIQAFLQRVFQTDGQAILFVPRLQDVFRLVQWLKNQSGLNREELAGVYAQDPEREEKIRQFRQGHIRILISTTILERGVTVKRCHVAVIGADHIIFDQASIVQIAGRVGRSAVYQQGEVWLIAQEKTDAQLQAIREMKNLNHCSKKAGFFTKGLYSL